MPSLNYRQLMGATDPANAEPGTIRCELAVTDPDTDMLLNVVHGSDSMENAKREIALFFDPGRYLPSLLSTIYGQRFTQSI